MFHGVHAIHARRPALLSATILLVVAACGPGLRLDMPVARPTAALQAEGDSSAPPVVQLRYFPYSPRVAVVAWAPDENGWGLRGAVRLDGTMSRDHFVFVSCFSDPGMTAATHAVLGAYRLSAVRPVGDLYACWFGDCSPSMWFGARIPDELLRERRDSLTVTFYGAGAREMDVALKPEVVAAYLEVVDSVRSALARGIDRR